VIGDVKVAAHQADIGKLGIRHLAETVDFATVFPGAEPQCHPVGDAQKRGGHNAWPGGGGSKGHRRVVDPGHGGLLRAGRAQSLAR
jgi:hypothetical protein